MSLVTSVNLCSPIILGKAKMAHHAKTTAQLLADMEYELRIPRNPVRLWAATCQYERYL
jgi:hypothetical protein